MANGSTFPYHRRRGQEGQRGERSAGLAAGGSVPRVEVSQKSGAERSRDPAEAPVATPNLR